MKGQRVKGKTPLIGAFLEDKLLMVQKAGKDGSIDSSFFDGIPDEKKNSVYFKEINPKRLRIVDGQYIYLSYKPNTMYLIWRKIARSPRVVWCQRWRVYNFINDRRRVRG